jgi:hypothetical protein
MGFRANTQMEEVARVPGHASTAAQHDLARSTTLSGTLPLSQQSRVCHPAIAESHLSDGSDWLQPFNSLGSSLPDCHGVDHRTVVKSD